MMKQPVHLEHLHMPHSRLGIAAVVLAFVATTSTHAQEGSGGPETTPPVQAPAPSPEEKAAAAEAKRLTVWTLQAKAACAKASVPADRAEVVVKSFVEIRAKHHAAVEALREQRRLEREEQGPGGAPLMDLVDLQKSIHNIDERARTQLATSLVDAIDRPLAERVYPLLAAFDARTDSLTACIVEIELDETGAIAAVGAIEQYYLDHTSAAVLARQDRAAWMQARQRARDALIAAVKPLLTEDQFAAFERRLGATGDPAERPNRRNR
jgi:hypothetical protein